VTRDKASKQKNRIPAARAWYNRLLFKIITIFNNCIIVKSYKMDRLILYCFTSRSRVFHLYGDVTIVCEGLQNLGLCSALRTFEQGGGSLSCHTCWERTSVFPVSSKGPSHSVASYDTHMGAEKLF
jgi:hypothetical protein